MSDTYIKGIPLKWYLWQKTNIIMICATTNYWKGKYGHNLNVGHFRAPIETYKVSFDASRSPEGKLF